MMRAVGSVHKRISTFAKMKPKQVLNILFNVSTVTDVQIFACKCLAFLLFCKDVDYLLGGQV